MADKTYAKKIRQKIVKKLVKGPGKKAFVWCKKNVRAMKITPDVLITKLEETKQFQLTHHSAQAIVLMFMKQGEHQ